MKSGETHSLLFGIRLLNTFTGNNDAEDRTERSKLVRFSTKSGNNELVQQHVLYIGF